VTNAELKLESQSSTLPRAGRSGKSLPLPVAANIPSIGLTGSLPGQQTNAAAAGEAAGVAAGKRRSAAHLHRMQTESSLAKVNAGKDASSESCSIRGGLSKKESYTMLRFPSTPDIGVDVPDVDSNAASTKSSHRPRSVENTDYSQRLPTDGHFKADDGSGLRADDAMRLVDASDRSLMPPPLSSAVPLSYQATFIAKAAKHRRTTMPESLSRSIAKHHRLSESSSATDGDDSPPSSSSSAAARKSNVSETSPLEPPERDIHKVQHRIQLTDALAQNKRSAEHSDSMSSTGSSVTGSPTMTKTGRCVSPVRPQSASSANFRRQLPADPRQSLSITSGCSELTTALDSVTVPQPSVMRSASAESGMRSVDSTQDSAAIAQSTSAGRLSTEPSADTPVQTPVAQQDGGQRLIASKTETRLVLNADSVENLVPCTAQQTIIDEIERYCTERRMSADLEQRGRPSPAPASGGRSRQQWEKTNAAKPLIMKSQSNSSVSQTASSSSVCDNSVLVDVSSLSRSSASSSSTADVAASVSDSVISYGSAAALAPAKLSSSMAAVAAAGDTNSSQHSTGAAEAAVEDKQMSELKAAHAASSGLPLSAMSSDK